METKTEVYIDRTTGTRYSLRQPGTGDLKGKWVISDCLKGKKRWKPVPAYKLLDSMQGQVVNLWSDSREKMEATLERVAEVKGWEKEDEKQTD